MPLKEQQPAGAAAVVECKHSCKSKETCGHFCCKRHLSQIPPNNLMFLKEQQSAGAAAVVEFKHSCKSKETCGHFCCKRHLSQVPQSNSPTPVSGAPALPLIECKHVCKHKNTCGHPCCKRHLPLPQLKSATPLYGASVSPSVECKHTCRDKLACGHQCCKRHFARDVFTDLGKQQPAVSNRVVPVERKTQGSVSTHATHQVRRSPVGPSLGVQGKSLVNPSPKKNPEATSSRPTDGASHHFFIYDIESTGMAAHD